MFNITVFYLPIIMLYTNLYLNNKVKFLLLALFFIVLDNREKEEMHWKNNITPL